MNAARLSVAKRMGIPPLWEISMRGKGVTVAVIDDGIAPDPLFAGKIVCDMDFTGEGRPRHKNNRHGTRVASCVTTIAEEASIANLRVVPEKTELTRECVIQALQHCIDVFPEYRIVNISLSFEPSGCPDQCPLCAKVDEAYRKGMLVIAAAGNKGPKPDTLTCPARSHWVIANMATETKSEKEYWENNKLKQFWHVNITGNFGKWYGTSYSAGYTSGAAALLLSAFPELDADTLRFAMIEVDWSLQKEAGHPTTLKFDQVYNYLLQLRKWASIGVIFTKNGALHPFLHPF